MILPMKSKSRSKPALLLLVGLSLLAGLAAAEILVRVLGVGPEFYVVYAENYRFSEDPALGYELVPGSRDGNNVISRDGWRDKDYPLAKPPGVFRILVIGDSVPFGLMVPRDETFPKQLEKLLNTETPGRFEVLNLSVTGYNITQIAETLRARGMKYDPDLVIYAYVLNDPAGMELNNELSLLKMMKRDAEDHWKRRASRGVDRWLSHSKLYLLLRHSLAQPYQPREPEVLDVFDLSRLSDGFVRELHDRPKTWKSAEDGMASIASAAGAKSVPVLVTIFPVRSKREGYTLSDIHAKVGALAKEDGCRVLDLAPAFQEDIAAGNEDLFLDYYHLTAHGHRVAAEAVKAYLDDYLPRAAGSGTP